MPGPACLCKLLALMVGCLMILHATSCGYFFCVRFPGLLDLRSDLYEDLQDISVLAGRTAQPGFGIWEHSPVHSCALASRDAGLLDAGFAIQLGTVVSVFQSDLMMKEGFPASSGMLNLQTLKGNSVCAAAGGPRRIEKGNFIADDSPKLIPKIIHQTYKSTRVPDSVKPLMQSWRRTNDDWEIRFYDDAACLQFVQREFPEYLEVYKALPKDVERSDFFR